MIDDLVELFDESRGRLPADGAATLNVFDREPRPGVARLDVEYGVWIAQVNMWDTGKTDVELGEPGMTGQIKTDLRDPGSTQAIRQLLGDVRASILGE